MITIYAVEDDILTIEFEDDRENIDINVDNDVDVIITVDNNLEITVYKEDPVGWNFNFCKISDEIFIHPINVEDPGGYSLNIEIDCEDDTPLEYTCS